LLHFVLLLLLMLAAMTKQKISKSRPRLHSKEFPTLGDYICPSDEYVERLYQEQAKLMANPPEFLCQPSTDCGLEPVDEDDCQGHSLVESNNELSKSMLKRLDQKQRKPKTKKIKSVSEPFFPPVVDDLLCQPRCYSYESASSRHSISHLDVSSLLLEPSYHPDNSLTEKSGEQIMPSANKSVAGATEQRARANTSTSTPLHKSRKQRADTRTTNESNTTPPEGICVEDVIPFHGTPNRQSAEIVCTPHPDDANHHKEHAPSTKDAAKWSPIKAKQHKSTTNNTVSQESHNSMSPLRTKLEQKFKSSPLKENATSNDHKNNTSHDLSSSSLSTTSRGSSQHQLSPLRIKLEEKFKSSPLKTSRRAPSGQEQQESHEEVVVVMPNENIEVEKSRSTPSLLGDLLCGPQHPWDEGKNDSTLETADDSFVEHSFVATAGESSMVLLETVEEFVIEPFAESILETTNTSIDIEAILAEQSYVEEGIEREWSQDGIERELSLSCILPNQTDIHNVAEPEEPLWVESEWSLEDESFLEEAISQLVEDVAHENVSDENPQESSQQQYHFGSVLRTMSRFPNRKTYQLHGMKILKEATDKNSSVIGAKAVPIILSSLELYPFERMHQWRGLMILINLMDRKVNAESFVLKHDGMKVVVNTLSEYSGDVGIVLAVCALISKVGEFESLRKPIADARAVKHLADVFHHHQGDPVVYEAARDTMKLLL
jgi:hypothetical protein